MTDAISRSAVLEMSYCAIKPTQDCPSIKSVVDVEDIEKLPALDVAPVVHAHWIKIFGSDGFVSTLRCSKCGNAENSTYIPGNFCWFCGARMDGEADA